jgi:hypothetical protein
MIAVFDAVLRDPTAYRDAALALPFQSVDVGQVFHGIAKPVTHTFENWFEENFPTYQAEVSFFRKSPLGQVEPNDIHNDVDMGDLTALLYLNPDPPEGDGTYFWFNREWNTDHSPSPLAGPDGKRSTQWLCSSKVRAQFNRCVVFSSDLFHSRGLLENYGSGDEARLIQVLFGRKVK